MERAELVAELKALRKGRGLQASRLSDRVGPSLRSACGVSESDGMVVIRAKVSGRLSELSAHLPDDLRAAVLAAFAITAEARLPLYQDRVKWAALRVDRDPRTVRRRVDEAIDLLAELALAPSAGALPGNWHTAALVVALVIGESRVFEQRRVVADEDGLRSLELPLPLSAALDGSVLYGGTLTDPPDGGGFVMELPRALSRGESWEYAVLFDVGSVVSPHLVCVPQHRCEAFDLRVRFGKAGPEEVLTLDGAFEKDIADPAYRGRPQPVDAAGEVHLRFQHLTSGLAYGLRWVDRNADDRSSSSNTRKW
ncbi:hypothetical protein [Amycolatopsis kentuckyensis]|uniref:hypothetical protein n=1 Tax=Amycolatopsis kentuckyensis TaxID=218823 RepID=UPI000A3BDCE3|nr:hypothetical protein [Amycolatopsis kentuckyensis]